MRQVVDGITGSGTVKCREGMSLYQKELEAWDGSCQSATASYRQPCTSTRSWAPCKLILQIQRNFASLRTKLCITPQKT